ncbi:hypothetical protein CN918_28590 [Priestia megaterium]|nr:hypothetical protein CN918_28590 [Priestia megaterium]
MKKWAIALGMSSTLLLAAGCSQTEPKATSTTQTATAEKKEEVKNPYHIKKIVVPVEEKWITGILAYQEFNVAVVKEIGDLYGVKVITEDVPTYKDAVSSVKFGETDVLPGAIKAEEGMTIADYTYLSSAIYYPDGTQLAPDTDYTMAVKTGNDKLLKLLNDGIRTLQKNGRLKELREEYVGDREAKEHPTVREVSTYDYRSKLTPEEKADLDKRMEEYSSYTTE